MNLKNISKRKLIILGVIVILLAVILGRVVMVSVLNRRFNKDMTANRDADYSRVYEFYEDGYYYFYRPANLFNMDCFARICTTESMKIYMSGSGEQTTNGMSITLFIWPEWSGEYTMGVIMEQNDSENSIYENFYIDEGINYIVSGSGVVEDEQKQLLEQYNEDVSELVERAVTKWRLE